MRTASAQSADARLRTVETHLRFENLHDLDGIMGTFGPSPRYDDSPFDECHLGPDRVRAYYEQLIRAAPDFEIEVRGRHVAEEAVIVEGVFRGTHLGTWRGLPATGRRVELAVCAVYTFDDTSRLAGERVYYDRVTLLAQLGLLHDPESRLGRILTPITHPLTVARAITRMARRRLVG
jgi:steroid delta-isomerase-like uncharacterized protein